MLFSVWDLLFLEGFLILIITYFDNTSSKVPTFQQDG